MGYLLKFRAVAIALLVAGAATLAIAQQDKGDSEVGLNGAVTIPHSDASSTTGVVTGSYGYYFTKHDLIGFDSTVILSKGIQDVALQGRYRRLIPTSNPRVFPFLGAAAGVDILHEGSSVAPGGVSVTDHPFVGTGEAGVKFFLSQRSAFEVAYNFQYLHNSGSSFSQNSFSIITFGFTHIFGGHHQK